MKKEKKTEAAKEKRKIVSSVTEDGRARETHLRRPIYPPGQDVASKDGG